MARRLSAPSHAKPPDTILESDAKHDLGVLLALAGTMN